jgi:hypothetical protein
LASPIIEILIALEFYRESVQKLSDQLHIRRASKLSTGLSLPDGMKWVSVGWYNLGSALYKRKDYVQAELCFLESCEHLKALLCINGISLSERQDMAVNLSKRLEALGSCQIALSKSEVSEIIVSVKLGF